MKKSQSKIPIIVAVFLLAIAWLSPKISAKEDGLIAWWKFDEKEDDVAIDSVNQIRDVTDGNFKYVKRSSGSALKFDGFTTVITRKAADAPGLSEALTVEAWVALATYPWNWCPIVSQEKEEQAGYSFDGIIDEVKIYERALTPKEIQQAFKVNGPTSSPALPQRVMPSGPVGPGRFGAYYHQLKNWPLWPDHGRNHLN